MNIASLSINRPVLASVISIIIIIFGIIGFSYLGVREFPSVDPPIITVTTNSYTFDTLNSYSNYDIYLRSSCSGNTFSTAVIKPFSTLINHCVDEVFFDSGNTTSNYNNGEYIQTTMNPINAGDQVSATFTAFSLEDGADNLRIFNGPDITSPYIQEELFIFSDPG